MRRLFVILLAFVLSQHIVKAQVSFDPAEGCLNIVDVTAGKGLGESGSDIISAHYLHERFINEQFCVGLGVGYSYLNSYQFSAIPLFFSTHYFFLDKRFSPFVNIRAGMYFPIGNSNQSGVNLYLAPSTGATMKVFSIIWLVVMWLLLIIVWVWYYADRKSEKRKKAPMILLAIGNFMLAIFFLVLLPLMKK